MIAASEHWDIGIVFIFLALMFLVAPLLEWRQQDRERRWQRQVKRGRA